MTMDDREARNAIFTAAAASDGRFQAMSAADRVRADFGLDIPVELAPMPSSGLVYPKGSPLCGLEALEIRAMTAREEDILTSRALLKKGTAITELIKSCLIDKSIDVNDMLVGDRNALMVAIRITGYGAEYNVEMECADCEGKTQHSFNLADLPIKRLSIAPVEEHSNVFEFALPASKKNVRFKFLTGRDEEEIQAITERTKKQQLGTDSNVTLGLQHAIISVDGVTDRLKVSNFIKMLPARDSLALRKYIKDNEPGIVMKQVATCEVCNRQEEVNMPIGVTFFWPATGQ